MKHELEFIQQFVVPAKRDRYLTLIQSKKGRRKLLDGLNHPKDLDMRRAHAVPSKAQTVDRLETLLKGKGASKHCHVISSDTDLDNSEMSLHEALEQESR